GGPSSSFRRCLRAGKPMSERDVGFGAGALDALRGNRLHRVPPCLQRSCSGLWLKSWQVLQYRVEPFELGGLLSDCMVKSGSHEEAAPVRGGTHVNAFTLG